MSDCGLWCEYSFPVKPLRTPKLLAFQSKGSLRLHIKRHQSKAWGHSVDALPRVVICRIGQRGDPEASKQPAWSLACQPDWGRNTHTFWRMQKETCAETSLTTRSFKERYLQLAMVSHGCKQCRTCWKKRRPWRPCHPVHWTANSKTTAADRQQTFGPLAGCPSAHLSEWGQGAGPDSQRRISMFLERLVCAVQNLPLARVDKYVAISEAAQNLKEPGLRRCWPSFPCT